MLEIEVQGARQVRDTLPEAVRIFIAPPSQEALRAASAAAPTTPRGRARACAPPATSSPPRGEFPHVVVNDRLEDAVEALAASSPAARQRPDQGGG